MTRWTTRYLAAATCPLAGCNQPAVTLKPPAFQSSENTVRNWNDVTDRIAAQMTDLGYLPVPGRPETPNAPPPTPVFIRVLAPIQPSFAKCQTNWEATSCKAVGPSHACPAARQWPIWT